MWLGCLQTSSGSKCAPSFSFFFKEKGESKAAARLRGVWAGSWLEQRRDLQQSPGARGRGHHLLAEPGGTQSLQGCAERAGPFEADLGSGFGVHMDFSGFGSDASPAIK